MKPYRLLPLIAAFLFSAVICHGKGASHQIMVSQDFTEALAKVLTAETNITVKRAIPPSYSPDVHTAYLKKHQSEFTDIAQQAEAVLTAVGAWPDDPLYPGLEERISASSRSISLCRLTGQEPVYHLLKCQPQPAPHTLYGTVPENVPEWLILLHMI